MISPVRPELQFQYSIKHIELVQSNLVYHSNQNTENNEHSVNQVGACENRCVIGII